ncbi:radial spoke head protein 3 [Histomonas meleagridis]|uniref:radial spoke head protein 3-like n=1 Tax=Histomonas meleagridis TaxID=135588 RepID=UPI0035594C6C|nr:radial spoke head protein 3 [Histomonas meleagridis]KAH0796300.1 radial spoke head protein 3-like [Histomonas meleagridis]
MLGESGGFTFQAGARPIEQKPKYRSDTNQAPCHITVDPRVCRGSTYIRRKQNFEEEEKPKPRKPHKTPSPRVRTLERTNTLGFPQQQEDRIDLEIQTEPYLHEINDKPIEVSVMTQTDAFLDRPPTPPYIPPKTGVDIETQVEESELFDFDFEVKPIVSTIVNKILEQSFMEVQEEEELANIRRHKEAIEHQRNVELADVQRLEEAERRKFEEKQRRIEERAKVEQAQNELKNKVAARGFSEFFASDLLSDAMNLLERNGYFYDEVEKEIKDNFLPYLAQRMSEASVTRELIAKITEKVNEKVVEIEEKQKMECQMKNVNDDERKKRMILRRMFVEDITANKIREAKKKMKKNEPNEEEEKNE